jgi:sulfonate transport system permease protein
MARLPQVAATARPLVPRPVRRLLGPAWLLGLWIVLSATGVISERTLAPPAEVWSSFLELVREGELQRHLWVSLRRVAAGLSIGITTGVVLALLAGLFRWGEDLIDGPMQILRSLPVLALVPLMIVWFGIDETPKILLIALGVTFPVYINTFGAIRNVDARLVESAGTFGVGRLGLARHVILPSALPGFFTGLRFAFAVSWLVLVVSEQVNATSGIGYLVTTAREFLRTDVIVVGLLVYGALGFTSDGIVRLLERSALQWRPNFTGT